MEILESRLSHCVSFTQGPSWQDQRVNRKISKHTIQAGRDSLQANYFVNLSLTKGHPDSGNHQFYNINKYTRANSLAEMFVRVITLKYKCQHTKSLRTIL